MSTITFELEENLNRRLVAAAKRRGEAPEALIFESIAQMVQELESDIEFHRVADECWVEYLVTGESISWDDARAYLKSGQASTTTPCSAGRGESRGG
jgi:predicted transcriptional regulator